MCIPYNWNIRWQSGKSTDFPNKVWNLHCLKMKTHKQRLLLVLTLTTLLLYNTKQKNVPSKEEEKEKGAHA